jgi:hypothetical protein
MFMEQNFKNHSRYVPLYHLIAAVLLVAILIGSIRNLVQSFDDEHRLYNAALIVGLTITLVIVYWYARAFALRAQDRVIMLEEKLRHQQLTGKPLNPKLRPGQIIALRFAGDAELPALAERAATENLPSKSIKEAIQHWRADNYRV